MVAAVTSDDMAAWARALGFSLEALARNRRGLVTPDQLRGFGVEMFRDILMSAVFTGSGVIVVPVLKQWWRWLACVGLACVAGYFVYQGFQSMRDRLHPQALAVEGKPVFEGGYRQTAILRIGSRTFTVPQGRANPQDIQSLIPADRTYRLYYLRHTGRPLSLEPVGSGR